MSTDYRSSAVSPNLWYWSLGLYRPKLICVLIRRDTSDVRTGDGLVFGIEIDVSVIYGLLKVSHTKNDIPQALKPT